MKIISEAFIFVTFVAHMITLVHAQNTTLITQTCNQTPNHELCISTLDLDPGTREAKTATDIAIILVHNVNKSSISIQNVIFGRIRNIGIDGPTRKLLNDCLVLYNRQVAFELNECLSSLLKKDYAFAQDTMDSVRKSCKSCENSFVAPIKSPISANSEAIDALAKVAYDIIKYIHSNNLPPLPNSLIV